MAAKSGCEKVFWLKSPLDSPHTQRVKNFAQISLRFRDKRVFAFNAEIQDGHQKWWENNFCKKSPVDSADIVWVKNFVKIALSLHF